MEQYTPLFILALIPQNWGLKKSGRNIFRAGKNVQLTWNILTNAIACYPPNLLGLLIDCSVI